MVLTEKIQSPTRPGLCLHEPERSATLPVMESFYTLQGEGYHAGKAAYFIRLGGCNVGCVWCDVKESWDADAHPQYTIEEVVKLAKEATDDGRQTTDGRPGAMANRPQITDHSPQKAMNNGELLSGNPSSVVYGQSSGSSNIVVVTGGEPLMHNLDALTAALHQAGFQTNIETSGSSPLSGHWDWICLSPKKFKAPLPDILPLAHELKVVIFNKTDFAWAEQHAARTSPNCKLYLQAEWSRRYQVMPLIVDYIKANPQWQLSLQVHKYIDVP